MKGIKVLIVDDSSLAREFIKAILATDGDVIIAGEAENGREAVEKTRALRPDIVIMDIEMPIMGGLEAIEIIMGENPVPILVVTSKGETDTAFRAISKGALEVLPKSAVDPDNPKKFIEQVKILSRVKVITHLKSRAKTGNGKDESDDKVPFKKIIAIAASTGGPNALNTILPELPKDYCCPIVIAQHISDGFEIGLAEWLSKISKLQVKVAEDGDLLMAGHVYISPPNRHMVVNYNNRISFLEKKARDIYHPSCDILLMSVATVYGAKTIGVILTGMGKDGVIGMQKIKEMQGKTIAQDQSSSIVFGMPKIAIETGCIDKVLPLAQIGQELLNCGRL
ncbi:MAG: chemotaxis-specific protein-glutamate methyltransferase CheB [Proteobacteria bacterium]|nr:chemotaxis-specific protein-glutamate methyltransferase CheB [Pseudomonadota bacterium]MBU1715477.1 chemotaxis-specific protein-glutamate methyltransferase CheB [Pseudomonadota bacterium]